MTPRPATTLLHESPSPMISQQEQPLACVSSRLLSKRTKLLSIGAMRPISMINNSNLETRKASYYKKQVVNLKTSVVKERHYSETYLTKATLSILYKFNE